MERFGVFKCVKSKRNEGGQEDSHDSEDSKESYFLNDRHLNHVYLLNLLDPLHLLLPVMPWHFQFTQWNVIER